MNSEGKLYKLLGEQAEKVEKLHLIDKRINKIKEELKQIGGKRRKRVGKG